MGGLILMAAFTLTAQQTTTVPNYSPGAIVSTTIGGKTTIVTNPPVITGYTTTTITPVAPAVVLAGVPATVTPTASDTATNPIPTGTTGVIGILQSYLLVNDPTYNGWQSNHVDLWQAAVFRNVSGVPGISAVGNVLGAELPVWRTTNLNSGFHVESLTDFETVFGDVGWQGIGLGYDYNIHQVQISGGLDIDIGLKDALTFRAAPFLEFKKASTLMGGLSPLFRLELEAEKHPSVMGFVGMQVPF